MTIKVEHNGEEIEVYTADEIAVARTEAATAKENEFKPKIGELEKDLGEARTALSERTGEFKQFRKLNEDQLKKLDEKDRIIYENTLVIQEQKEKDQQREKTARENLVLATIKTKVGTDEKLITKVKDMYTLIGIEANTPEEIEKKVLASLGALGQTEPDLIASVNGFNAGSFKPPEAKKDGDASFADTEKGKAGAKDLGLILEIPKK